LDEGSRPRGFRGEALSLCFRGEKYRLGDPFLGLCMRRPLFFSRFCVSRPPLHFQFVCESGFVRRLESERLPGGRFAALLQGWGLKKKRTRFVCEPPAIIFSVRPVASVSQSSVRESSVRRSSVRGSSVKGSRTSACFWYSFCVEW